MIRFVHFFSYAPGISVRDGEKWYFSKHVPQARELPGVQRYCSWRGLKVPNGIGSILSPTDKFVRRSELWLDNIEAAIRAVKASPELWAHSGEGAPGFGEFECMFINEEPQYDLLRDTPAQQYPYMTMPLVWPNGRPKAEEGNDNIVDSYFFSYPEGVSIEDGEDWYLGHHTREGKQLPGVKYYLTWRTLRVPDEPNSGIYPNRFVRLTDLGFPSFESYNATITGIRFSFTQLCKGYGEFAHIFIRPSEVEDLLKA